MLLVIVLHIFNIIIKNIRTIKHFTTKRHILTKASKIHTSIFASCVVTSSLKCKSVCNPTFTVEGFVVSNPPLDSLFLLFRKSGFWDYFLGKYFFVVFFYSVQCKLNISFLDIWKGCPCCQGNIYLQYSHWFKSALLNKNICQNAFQKINCTLHGAFSPCRERYELITVTQIFLKRCRCAVKGQ